MPEFWLKISKQLLFRISQFFTIIVFHHPYSFLIRSLPITQCLLLSFWTLKLQQQNTYNVLYNTYIIYITHTLYIYIYIYILEQKLRQGEKYWQAQLFTLTHGLNSSSDWYCLKRKVYRKLLVRVIHRFYELDLQVMKFTLTSTTF